MLGILSLCLSKHHKLNAYGGVDVQIHAFLTSTQHGRKWSISRPGWLPSETTRYPCNRREPGVSSLVVQSTIYTYTNWATLENTVRNYQQIDQLRLHSIIYTEQGVQSSWNVMAQGDAREGKWRGNWRMEWVASTLHTTSKHGISSITTADAYTWAASGRLNWCLRRF
jgi:hypothetical protein